MTSWVSLANRALYRIGDGGITSLSDTQSESAIAVNAVYEDIRDEVLALHPWDCALERDTFAIEATAPSWGYSYSYQLPADPWCLRVVRLIDLSIDWKVLGRHLHTDAGAPLYVEYLRRVTDPNELSPWVQSVFIGRLAYELAYRRSNSAALAESLEDKFWSRVLPTARGVEGQQGTPDEHEVAEFEEARL